MAKITLIGFYNYDNTLFDNLVVNEAIDKQTLIDNILFRGGEFEVSESNPDYIKLKCAIWSKKWAHTIDRWVNALSIDYNPLENYDRFEDWTDTNNTTGAINSSSNGTDNSTVENKVSAYDSNEYQPKDLSTANSSNSNSSNTTNRSDINGHHVGRLHGNIGVTTSQQMLQSELDIAKWNIYEQVTDLFLTEFVIPVY